LLPIRQPGILNSFSVLVGKSIESKASDVVDISFEANMFSQEVLQILLMV
jgi:hypothetical protein